MDNERAKDADCPAGRSEMAALIRKKDWSQTALGPMSEWPQTLKTIVRQLVDSTSQAAYIAWGPELLSIYNDGYIPIMGTKHPHALGMPFREVFAEVWEEYRPVVQAVMAGESQYFMDRPVALSHRPGIPMSWFTFSWTPLRDETGEVAGFFCLTSETTEVERQGKSGRDYARRLQVIEQTLRTSEARYRSILESIDEGFCTIEVLFDERGAPVDYQFLVTNASFERITGMRDAVGKRMREFAPEHEDYWFEIYGEIVRTGEPRRFVRHAAHVGRLWLDVFAFRLDPPEAHQLAVIFKDITEQKQATDALQANQSYLRQLNERKDEFLAMLAHELRNPLAAVQSGVEVIERLGHQTPQVADALQMMTRQLAHTTRLVSDLMDVSRISRGIITLQTQPVAVVRIVEDAVAATKPTCARKQQTLRVVLPADTLYLDADPMRLQQVVGNLLNNASKYTPVGGQIQVVVRRDGDAVSIRVQDNGIGIAPSHLSEIFDAFAQLERSSARPDEGGLGLGLAVVKNLVQMHGGSVRAESAGPGQGSAFVVRLPLLREAPAAAAAVEHTAATTSQRPRVLLIDDNQDIADSLQMLLQAHDYPVAVAYDGESGVQMALDFQPEVVLLDLGLPDISGHDVCRRIRQQAGGADRFVVAATGWGTRQDREKSREAGFDEHLVKPVTIKRLLAMLAELAGR